MRFRLVLLPALFAAVAAVSDAETLSAKVVRLIPDSARFIFGVDVDRYSHSELSAFYPMPLDRGFERQIQNVRQIVFVECEDASGRGRLTILVGTRSAPSTAVAPDRESAPYDDTLLFLDDAVAIRGEKPSVDAAVARWRAGGAASSEVARRVRRLSETYDNWAIAIRPLDNRRGREDEPASNAPHLKYRDQFAGLIESVSGGVRVGRMTEVRVDVALKEPDAAMALAALARFAPGMIQAQSPHSMESALAEIAENLTATPTGNTVSLSFTLDEGRLRELKQAREKASHASPF
jgi:hypothetical protein